MKTPKRILITLASMALAIFMAGCATTSGGTTEEKVLKLAEERWDLVLAGDYMEAYEYYSPGYRSSVDITDYIVEMKVRRVRWVSKELKDMTCQESVCTIQWNIGYEIYQPVPGLEKWRHFTPMQDDWIKLNGNWWYVPPKRNG